MESNSFFNLQAHKSAYSTQRRPCSSPSGNVQFIFLPANQIIHPFTYCTSFYVPDVMWETGQITHNPCPWEVNQPQNYYNLLLHVVRKYMQSGFTRSDVEAELLVAEYMGMLCDPLRADGKTLLMN